MQRHLEANGYHQHRPTDGQDGKVRYVFGGNEPLGISKVARLLEIERDLCYVAFDAFIKLVAEQTAAITSFHEKQSWERRLVPERWIGFSHMHRTVAFAPTIRSPLR
ncbi:hypothetical protein DSM25558_2896 [Agrobacterium sp. DSM 25558]|nr:hypothetical protein DSM25558_2896 [Agrobacterium sp. DSM 25558]